MYSTKIFISNVDKVWYVIEKECLGVVFALKDFKHHFLVNTLVFHVDEQELVYLGNKLKPIESLSTWTLLLQKFDYIIYRYGREKLEVD